MNHLLLAPRSPLEGGLLRSGLELLLFRFLILLLGLGGGVVQLIGNVRVLFVNQAGQDFGLVSHYYGVADLNGVLGVFILSRYKFYMPVKLTPTEKTIFF